MVHAVLARHAPDSPRIDITHAVPVHDIRSGSLTLWRAAPWLAPGVILAVVDPGVGTGRRSVALNVGDTTLVGPDNGLLTPAALRLGDVDEAVQLHAPEQAPAGATFAGRDIFAPAAGRLAGGCPLYEVGAPIDPATLIGEPVALAAADPDGEIDAEVLWVDRYGNTQLNVAAVEGDWLIDETPVRTVTSYGDIAPDSLALVIDSYGHLSVCADRSSAAEHLGLRPGGRIRLRRQRPDRG